MSNLSIINNSAFQPGPSDNVSLSILPDDLLENIITIDLFNIIKASREDAEDNPNHFRDLFANRMRQLSHVNKRFARLVADVWPKEEYTQLLSDLNLVQIIERIHPDYYRIYGDLTKDEYHSTSLEERVRVIRDFLKEPNEETEQRKHLYITNKEPNQKAHRLTYIPEEITYFSKIQTLDLSNNSIRNIPSCLTKLKELQTLDLSNNKITTIPKELAELQNLETLRLHYNQITNIPDSIEKLKQLTSLGLSNNQISKIPESLGSLTQLESLNLDFNPLKEAPSSLGNLKKLEYLALDEDCNLPCNQWTYDVFIDQAEKAMGPAYQSFSRGNMRRFDPYLTAKAMTIAFRYFHLYTDGERNEIKQFILENSDTKTINLDLRIDLLYSGILAYEKQQEASE